MSHFSGGQLNQLGDALEVAGWTPDDVTKLEQAGKTRLTAIRLSLLSSDIVSAIETGATELWLHDEQKTGWVKGRKILVQLTESSLFAGCADLDELKIIQAQGIEFFRRYFTGKAIFGWRGFRDGNVPFLIESGDRVVLDRYHLYYSWRASDPALRRN